MPEPLLFSVEAVTCSTCLVSLQQANPSFKLSHTGDDADTNYIMMVDRGPSKQDSFCLLACAAQCALVCNLAEA